MAIVKPQGEKLTKRTLRNCFESNPDGAGFALASDGELRVLKGFFTFKSFWKAFSPMQSQGEALIHFRWQTHGPKDVKNTHPWMIDDNHAMVHNGILNDFTSFNSKISDTGRFVNEILRPMFKSNPEAWKETWAQYLIEEAIGFGNKVAILDANGEYVIFKEKSGEWDNGCWFSNSGYRYAPISKTYYYPARKTFKGFGSGDHPALRDWKPENETELILGRKSQLGERKIIEMKSGDKIDLTAAEEFLRAKRLRELEEDAIFQEALEQQVEKHEDEVARQVRETLKNTGQEHLLM